MREQRVVLLLLRLTDRKAYKHPGPTLRGAMGYDIYWTNGGTQKQNSSMIPAGTTTETYAAEGLYGATSTVLSRLRPPAHSTRTKWRANFSDILATMMFLKLPPHRILLLALSGGMRTAARINLPASFQLERNCAPSGGGGGNVSTSGSPLQYQLAQWVSGTTIQGVGPGTQYYPFVSNGASSYGSFQQLTSAGLNITTTLLHQLSR